jgi:carboxylate-amine ligase
MSGRAPFFLEWDKFLKNFYEPMLQTGIVRSMKDFYWDIRPKPEYGTIELRICDTPLSLYDAGLIAGFMQILCRAILADGIVPDESEYMVYTHNRFQATRFGFQAEYVDPVTRKSCNLRESFTSTIDWLREFEDSSMMENILLDEIEAKVKKCTDAELLVEQFQRSGNMEDVVFWSMNRFQAPFQDRVMEVLNCSSKR